MALVDEEQEIFGEEIEQAVGAFAWLAAVKIARVVLDAATMAQFLDHLHVILHALLYALCFDRIAKVVKIVDLCREVILNHPYSLICLLLRRYEQVGRVDLVVVKRGNAVKCHGIKFLNRVDLIVPPRNAQNVVAVSHRHVYRVALDAEEAALQFHVVAHIQRLDEPSQKGVAVDVLSALYAYYAVGHGCRASHAVDARHRRHHHHVLPPREQGAHGSQSQLVNVLVYGEVFLNVCVGGGQVGLRLVIVVIGHIIFYRVVREETLHLFIKLRGERLVVAEDEGRAVYVVYDVGHGEGLSRACDAEQHLCVFALLYAIGQFLYGFGLVACG